MMLQASSYIRHLADCISSLGEQLSKYHEPAWQYMDTLKHANQAMEIPKNMTTEFVCQIFKGSQKKWDELYVTHKMQEQGLETPGVGDGVRKAVNRKRNVFMTWIKQPWHKMNSIEVRFYTVKDSKQVAI